MSIKQRVLSNYLMTQDRGSADHQRDQAPRLLFVANVSFSFIHRLQSAAEAFDDFLGEDSSSASSPAWITM